ncbi:cyclic AMP response element-binding protein B isoform X3 [Plodia interpunctella]|uniref:cyclic AMP response element-binding protein B isoform X3 n=1 Tax=Plodia interpunctella TaxID=58824 RepID=UPI0023677816|nr:cyclic AMP response element-binding protein B isoform X3 [Plodia interpunctella]
MDGMVEENGTSGGAGASDPLAGAGSSAAATQHVVAVTSIVQLTLPTQAPSAQVQSVIQPNQQSVIQTASNLQSVQLPKGNVILVSKPNSVIHTTQGSLQTLQIKPEPNTVIGTQGQSCSDDSCSDDESPKRKYREMLSRRPSYRKILNDLGGAEIAENRMGSKPGCENEVSLSSSLSFAPVIPAGALQGESGLHTLAVSGAAGGGAIVQYANQDAQFYVPEDQTRKRELRLLKNREAARECRRKKKEYIKCLENRVAVLENQNKALIEELKSLKELYCQQKTE